MKNYLSLVKFSHTIFAMPFALTGFFLGISENGGHFESKLLFLVVCCMIFARSAAMAFNRWLDSDIDAKNPRTQIREIPAGIISSNAAFGFVIVNCLGFILSSYFINTICFVLSPIALMITLGYSYTKRFTALCHLVLGLGLALAPVGAYLAVCGKFDLIPVLLGVAVMFWVAGFDIIYALQDEEFDKANKLNSIPVFLGRTRAMRFSEFFHILTCIFISAAIYLSMQKYDSVGYLTCAGSIIFLALLVYQHLIIKPGDLSKVNIAFFTTNGVASLIFGFLFILDLLV